MRIRIPGATTTVANPGALTGRSGAAAVSRERRNKSSSATFGKKAMYENLMEEAVTLKRHATNKK